MFFFNIISFVSAEIVHVFLGSWTPAPITLIFFDENDRSRIAALL